jgi:hypothetical protein
VFLLKQYVTLMLRILSPDRQWESFLLLKLISCPFFDARSSGRSASTIAQQWCCLRSVGVISDIHDVSLPDKRLAPRVLLRQDPFMALSESAARSFSVFRVSQVEQTAHSSKLILRNCVLRHTLSPDVQARCNFECKRSDISQHWQRGTLVDISAGDLVIVSTKPPIYWPFFVISSKHQHAWSRYVLLQDPRNRPQTYEFDPSSRETFREFVISLSANERPCDWQEQFLLFLQRQPSDTQESFVRVSFFVVQME